MKTIFSFLFSLLILPTFSQNWECINDSSEYYYSDINDQIEGIKFDSIKDFGSYKDKFLFRTIVYDTSTGCFLNSGLSWQGEKVTKFSNNIFCFYNKQNDSIFIHTSEGLNYSWIFYSFINGNYVEATITNLTNNVIPSLGIIDSAKTISFAVKDPGGNPVSDPLNNKTLTLSKNHGLINIFRFCEFPVVTVYSLIGMSKPESGKTIPVFKTIYDFSIGDEFYIVEEANSIPYNYSQTKYLYKIMGYINQFDPDTISYLVEECYKKEYVDFQNNSNNYIIIKHDTIIMNYGNPDFLDFSPYKVYYDGNAYSYLSSAVSNLNDRLSKIYCSYYSFLGTDTCLIPLFSIPEYCHEYIAGLGGPYYDINEGGDYIRNQLLYYKKGSEIFGNYVPCDVILNNDEPETENYFIEIFPNPFSDKATIKTGKENFKPYTLEIYNVFGQKLRRVDNIILPTYTIEKGNLSSGLYFYSIIGGNNKFSGKFVIE